LKNGIKIEKNAILEQEKFEQSSDFPPGVPNLHQLTQ
jgi:hypothetical protein